MTVFDLARTTTRTFAKTSLRGNKEKANSKKHNINQSGKNSDLINNLSVLDLVRLNHASRIFLSHLNIDFLRNKFEMLREIVQDKLDISLVSETKVDPSFPSSQFLIEGFSSLFKLDRNISGDGIMLYIREEIPSKPLSEYKPNSPLKIYY